MREWAQVIDTYTSGDARWYEFWSVDRQERFSLKIKDGKSLVIGNIVRVDELAGKPLLRAIAFDKTPSQFADRLLVDAVSFNPTGAGQARQSSEAPAAYGLARSVTMYDVYFNTTFKAV